MPISPEEALNQKRILIPEEVYGAFDDCIVNNLSPKGVAIVNQEEVIDHILAKFESNGNSIDRSIIFSNKWLDIEPYYVAVGWAVSYEPISCTSPACFTFRSINKQG